MIGNIFKVIFLLNFMVYGLSAETNGLALTCGHILWQANGVSTPTVTNNQPVVIEVIPQGHKDLSSLPWQDLRPILESLKSRQIRRSVLMLPLDLVFEDIPDSVWRIESVANRILSLLQSKLGQYYGETITCLSLQCPNATAKEIRAVIKLSELAYEAGLLVVLRERDFTSDVAKQVCGILRTKDDQFELILRAH